jgi:uncharacterized membrane protein
LIAQLIGLFNGLPHSLVVLIFAALPIIEVRGSIPLGLFYFKMDTLSVLLISFIGGVLPVFPILWFLENLTAGLRKINVFDRFFGWLFMHTRAKSGMIERFELVGLTLFMALPVPGTGIWTGCVAAYLLELPWIPTFICALIANALATALVWLASMGLVKLI